MPLSVTTKIILARPRAARVRPHFQPNHALRGELHRIVDEVFQRRAQPHRIADQHFRQIVRDRDLGAQALGLRARRQRFAQRLDQTPRPKRLLLQRERTGIGFGGVDHQRGERGEMLGAAS